jgi:hypothetical protein
MRDHPSRASEAEQTRTRIYRSPFDTTGIDLTEPASASGPIKVYNLNFSQNYMQLLSGQFRTQAGGFKLSKRLLLSSTT